MTVANLSLHDTDAFPLVRLRSELCMPGYGAGWCAEMEYLLDAEMPFVLIYPPRTAEEEHEDRKLRGAWLKKNSHRMADVCRLLVAVEADPVRRAALQAALPGLERAFGTPQVVVASVDEANKLARRIIADETAGRLPPAGVR